VAPGTTAIGEVGLLGELRSVGGLDRRLREVARLGFRRAIVPRGLRSERGLDVAGLEVIVVGTLRDAVERALADDGAERGEAPSGDTRLTARAEPTVGSGARPDRRGSR
jgi:DNA repair protein RadA/Sms